jgi:DNA polymerase sigma
MPSEHEDEEEEQDTRTPREILEQIGRKLRRSIPQLYIQYKTHARIPIIKTYARRNNNIGKNAMWNKFVADISVGNVLAVHNTRLIKAYTGIEERYRYLVLFCESLPCYLV